MSKNVDIIFWIFSFLFPISQQGFIPGRIQEGVFEYNEINGRMSTSDARLLCEADVRCGGFTLRGILSPRVKQDIFFFHFVAQVRLETSHHVNTWEWMTYKVARKFLVFRGAFFNSYNRDNWRQVYNSSFNIHKFGQTHENGSVGQWREYDALMNYCHSLDVCMAVAQHKDAPSQLVVFDTISFLDFSQDTNWITVISLDAEDNQISDPDREWTVNRCCPATEHYSTLSDIKVSVPQRIKKIPCTISSEKFRHDYIRTRTPVVLEGCIDPSLFSNHPKRPDWLKFQGMSFDDILHKVWYGTNSSTTQRSRPKLRRKLVSSMRNAGYDGDKISLTYQMVKKMHKASLATDEDEIISPSWTHDNTPNNANHTMAELIQMRANNELRVFIKASSMKVNIDCYEKYRQEHTDLLKDGYESCLLLDGLWKPPPLPSDLYEITQYNNDIAWIIMSTMTSGSQLHQDPDLMGAWNALLLGRKWWVVFPYPIPPEELACDNNCSPGSEDAGHVWPWFKHVLPQLRDKKFYGKALQEFIQEPGQVVYIPHQMPHTIFNVDDNVAITENYLFPDALPSLVKAMALNIITPHVKWNEERAFKSFYYKYASKDDRERMRGMYDQITKLIGRFPHICNRDIRY